MPEAGEMVKSPGFFTDRHKTVMIQSYGTARR